MWRKTLLSWTVSTVLALAACGVETGNEVTSTATDLDGFIAVLEAQGAQVELAGRLEQPFFSVSGHMVFIEGEGVQVFEYEHDDAAQIEADLVSPDGSSIGTSMASWIAPPHFFHSGRILVLYVGEDASLQSMLTTALGPQFAGR